MSSQTVEGFFYENRDEFTRSSARSILKHLKLGFGTSNSVLDVGCGVGTWLAVAAEIGATSCKGIEGPWIRSVPSLVIPDGIVMIQDLESEFEIEGVFDLGICLEVAEHLSEPSGKRLVKLLASHCDVVLFSAAIPGQGGNGHVNEQPPSYWQKHFANEGMLAVDAIRPYIYNIDSIPWWYRQNAVVFATPSRVQEYFERLASTKALQSVELPLLRISPRFDASPLKPVPRLTSRVYAKVRSVLGI